MSLPGPGLRVVFFGTPDFAVPTLEALLGSRARRRRRRHATRSAARQGPQDYRCPGEGGGRRGRRADPAASSASGTPLFSRRSTALRADIGGRGRLRKDPDRRGSRQSRRAASSTSTPRCCPGTAARRPCIARSSPASAKPASRSCGSCRRSTPGRCWRDARRPIGADETSDEVERDLARLGAALLVETLDELAAGRRQGTPAGRQPGDLCAQAHEGRRRRRLAVAGRTHPQPDSRAASVAACVHVSRRPPVHPAPVALVRRAVTASPPARSSRPRATHLAVATGAGILEITEIQSEGKRPMTVREFLAGPPAVARRTLRAS